VRFDGVLEFPQFGDERLGNDVGPHAQELAGLHESRAKLLGCHAEAFPDAAPLARLGDDAV
jgi:hypothetical protein